MTLELVSFKDLTIGDIFSSKVSMLGIDGKIEIDCCSEISMFCSTTWNLMDLFKIKFRSLLLLLSFFEGLMFL